MSKKLLTLFAAGAMTLTLAACGNNDTTSHKSADHVKSEKVVKHSSSATKKATSALSSSETVAATTSSKNAAANSSVAKSNGTNTSTVKANQTTSTRAPMTAQDAKNIVKEHLLAVINDAGINGQPKPNVPSMDEIDTYTATQNGVNDWTVSGNGHTYHVTATSVTEE